MARGDKQPRSTTPFLAEIFDQRITAGTTIYLRHIWSTARDCCDLLRISSTLLRKSFDNSSTLLWLCTSLYRCLFDLKYELIDRLLYITVYERLEARQAWLSANKNVIIRFDVNKMQFLYELNSFWAIKRCTGKTKTHKVVLAVEKETTKR